MEFTDYTEEEKQFYDLISEVDSFKTNKYPILNGDKQLYIGSKDRIENFAHVTGWKENKSVLTGITASDYKVYCPIVENKGLIVVNGYLVDSDSNETLQTYDFNWDDIITPEISDSINSLPEMVSSYIQYRTKNPTEIP